VKLAFARVVESERLYGNSYITWFDAPAILNAAVPGQFVMFRCVEPLAVGESAPAVVALPEEPFLPRAMSIHRVRDGANGKEWSILYDVVGRGTRWLASRRAGDLVFCWGPLGNGYQVEKSSKHLLMLAGGIGIAPLVWLADEAIAARRSVTLVVGGRTQHQVFPSALLPREVEVIVYTEDGSLGRTGRATEGLAEYVEWSDQAFACGPNAMFGAMAEVLRPLRLRRSVQVLLEERMGCGTGICYGCAVETRRKGMRLVCKDGPMFELRDVF
jgi:dihydroorotate dehydrogenase electron transfer subunit